ncbi:hypothetical protein GCM10027443_24030 [Pontibacter brevis]
MAQHVSKGLRIYNLITDARKQTDKLLFFIYLIQDKITGAEKQAWSRTYDTHQRKP